MKKKPTSKRLAEIFGSKATKRSSGSVQRLVRHPDSDAVDWIANFATEINSLNAKVGEEVELLARDDDNLIIVTRRGKTTAEAFRKCLKHAMTQFKMPNS